MPGSPTSAADVSQKSNRKSVTYGIDVAGVQNFFDVSRQRRPVVCFLNTHAETYRTSVTDRGLDTH